ncbi:MAG TPA: AAA family ATPase, partial [Candidatus Cybelea sp.]|nr:AAA family ATPase [Candidatus Cybelea sp.]
MKGANYRDYFREADVVIVPDNDADPKKGRAHANIIAKDLHDVAQCVRVLTLPDGYKDLSEWVEAVGTREELDRLVEHAPEFMNGYDPGAQEQPQAPQPGSDKPPPPFYLKTEFVRGFRPPDYLIDGLLQRRFVYSLTGPTGHAKTAIALLMAQLVSCNDPNAMLGNRKVEHGRVVYFVGENPDDIRMRVIGADWMRNDDPMSDVIVFVPGVFNIGEMQAYLSHQIMRQLGGVDFVVVDTSAAYFLGDDEISNTQIGNHARMLRRLTELPGGPCVLVLCHPIKHAQEQNQLVPRGGGAFLAEVDGNLTVWRKTESVIELYYTGKLRGAGFEPMHFELETI